MRTPASVRLALVVVTGALVLTAGRTAPLHGQATLPITTNQFIRVDTMPGSGARVDRVRGLYLSADSARIYVDPEGPGRNLAVSRSSVRSLEVRTSRSGAAAGLKAGFLIGAGSAAAIGGYMLLSGWDAGDAMGGTVLFGAIFGGAGALLGSVLGLAAQPEGWSPAQMPPPAR